MREQQIILKEDADPPLVWCRIGDVVAIEYHPACRPKLRCECAGDEGEQSRFADARWPHDRQHFTRRDLVA